MLFDKIGRKFYSPDEIGAELPPTHDEIGAGSPTGETIYSGGKPYLNTEHEPLQFTEFPEFNNFVLTPYLGMALSIPGSKPSKPTEDSGGSIPTEG